MNKLGKGYIYVHWWRTLINPYDSFQYKFPDTLKGLKTFSSNQWPDLWAKANQPFEWKLLDTVHHKSVVYKPFDNRRTKHKLMSIYKAVMTVMPAIM